MRFAIVVPTVRLPRCANVLAQLLASLTLPSDVHILTGEAGKSQTLNRQLAMLPNDVTHYVTIDDDLILYRGWQDELLAAFEVWPEFGAFGFDVSHTPAGLEYMREAATTTPIERGGVKIRDCTGLINIGGCFLAMRSNTARDVEPYPFCGGRRHQVDEDGWRCRRVMELGLRIGYVIPRGGKAEMIDHVDSAEYTAEKWANYHEWCASPQWT